MRSAPDPSQPDRRRAGASWRASGVRSLRETAVRPLACGEPLHDGEVYDPSSCRAILHQPVPPLGSDRCRGWSGLPPPSPWRLVHSRTGQCHLYHRAGSPRPHPTGYNKRPLRAAGEDVVPVFQLSSVKDGSTGGYLCCARGRVAGDLHVRPLLLFRDEFRRKPRLPARRGWLPGYTRRTGLVICWKMEGASGRGPEKLHAANAEHGESSSHRKGFFRFTRSHLCPRNYWLCIIIPRAYTGFQEEPILFRHIKTRSADLQSCWRM